MLLRLHPISPLCIRGDVSISAPELLLEGDCLFRVDHYGFVRRLLRAERASFEAALNGYDGIRDAHLFMAQRTALAKADSTCVGWISAAARKVFVEYLSGRRGGFRLPMCGSSVNDVIGLTGGHLRAALRTAAGAITSNQSRGKHSFESSLWRAFSFGPIRLAIGTLQPWVVVGGRFSCSAKRPLVLVTHEDWLHVHCGLDETVLEATVLPAVEAESSRNELSDEFWDQQCRRSHWMTLRLNRQLEAISRRVNRGQPLRALEFLRRAQLALSLVREGNAIVAQIGGSLGRLNVLQNDASMRCEATIPGAVFFEATRDRWFEDDFTPLGWVLVQRVRQDEYV